MLTDVIKVTCIRCGQSFMWDLNVAPAHKSKCPYCQTGDKKIETPKPKKKRRRKRMLTAEERYPENPEKDKPEYPQEWFLDFHCKSVNQYHMSPHLRVRDKGAAYRALEKLDVPDVRRTRRKVKVAVISFRQRLVDRQSLYAGSSKGLIDVLVRKGWIHDDTEEWCDLVMSQEKVLKKDMDDGKRRGTLVRLEAIPKPRKKKTKSR